MTEQQVQPTGVRYWVGEDTDYYATFDWVVFDGPREDCKYVGGFNTQAKAEAYAEYLNDHDDNYEYVPHVCKPGCHHVTMPEAAGILQDVYLPAVREALNNSSMLLKQFEPNRFDWLRRLLRMKRTVTSKHVRH